jgi:hypothetical protein
MDGAVAWQRPGGVQSGLWVGVLRSDRAGEVPPRFTLRHTGPVEISGQCPIDGDAQAQTLQVFGLRSGGSGPADATAEASDGPRPPAAVLRAIGASPISTTRIDVAPDAGLGSGTKLTLVRRVSRLRWCGGALRQRSSGLHRKSA